ncbi:hypothetical protein BC830DRAFT_284531 [Chytriomyces sp. MP71]|nr:hypothetical protein BC830DRAFT_284531 [Chytriomyces sp. MP71]
MSQALAKVRFRKQLSTFQVCDEPTSFRVQLRVPSYSAFLLSSRDTISAHIIDMLLEGDESKMTAAGLHHLKLDVSGFRLVLARDSRGRIRLELEIGKVDILELVVANDPAELDHAPLHEYTALLSLRGAQTSSRLHDRARTLYSQLDDMQTGSGGGGVRGPENVFRFGVPRSTAGRGGFGDRRGEDGAVGVRVRVDLATREARGRVGDVCMFVDVCRLQRTMDLVSEFLGTSGTGTGAGNKDEDCSESLFSDEEGHSTAPSTAERPIFMQLSIDLVRVWTFIPAMKLATKSRDGINPQKLVIDVLDTRVSLNDPNQTKISHVGHNVVTTATYIQIGGIGMSLATPVTLWREYNLVPLAFVGVLGSEPPAFCTLSVQTMRPSIISMASTVYYDGHEGYDDEVENDEVDEDLDEVEGQDEDAFGTKSWFNVDESLETEGAFKTPRARPSLSALEKARSRAMADSKTALLVHLNRIRVNLGKAEFDILMLLVNDLQLWLLSETASPEAPLLGDPVTQNDFDNEPASNNPFKLGLILQIDEIAVRLFSAFTPTGLEWAYNLNLADSRLVATFSANGDIKCNMELDNVSVTDVDGQFIILRSEVSDQRRPMTNLIFKSIFDKIINMKENTVSISLSEFRMMIVGETMALLQRDLQGFFQEPPGMMPVDAVDAVNNITVVLNRSLLDYRPLYRNFRAALVISKMKVLLNLIPHSPTMGVDLSFCDLMVYILKSSSLIGFDIDEQSLMVEKGLMSYLKECRYARVFSCDVLDLSFRQTQSIDFSGTKVEIGLSNSHAYLDCCLDSYRLLLDIAEYVASGGDSQHSGDIAVDAALMPEKTETRRKMSVNVDHNIMGKFYRVCSWQQLIFLQHLWMRRLLRISFPHLRWTTFLFWMRVILEKA